MKSDLTTTIDTHHWQASSSLSQPLGTAALSLTFISVLVRHGGQLVRVPNPIQVVKPYTRGSWNTNRWPLVTCASLVSLSRRKTHDGTV